MPDSKITINKYISIRQAVVGLKESFPEANVTVTDLGPVVIENGRIEFLERPTQLKVQAKLPKPAQKELTPSLDELRVKEIDSERKRWVRREVLIGKARTGKSK